MREAPDLNNFEWALKMALETPPEEYFSAEAVQPTNMFAKLMEDSPRNRLKLFCYYVKSDKQIPKETLQWLAEASRQYLEGERRLVTALGLEKPDRSPRRMKQFHAGIRMFALIKCEGMTYELALWQVEEESGLGERNIQTHYAEVRDCAEALSWCKKSG